MPPFGEAIPVSNGFHSKPNSNIISINVGGQIFQTTKQTLSSAGPKSILSKIALSTFNHSIPFIDRDPDLFSILLSLLRTSNLPSKANSFDFQDLISESQFYGIENLLVNSQSNPSQLDPFNLQKSFFLPLTGRDSPSAISTTRNGSLHVAHGSKLTSFDWSLKRKSTIVTQFTAIDSLLALSPSLAAAGATDFSGLQIIHLNNGVVQQTLNWENVTKSGSTVQAIGASNDHLFTSFESYRRNSNCVMIYDLNDGLRPVSTIAHYEIFGADINSAIPSTKLQWIDSHNLLMASGSHSGPSGVLGSIKFFDIRSGNVAWEVKEKTDCFADVTVSDTLSTMFKVGVNTGEVYYADLRYMNGENMAWTCLGDGRKGANGKREGLGCKIETHGGQVMCSKGGNLELWSEVLVENGGLMEVQGRVMMKNVMGRVKDMDGSRITNLRFGGNKMFVTRKDQQCVEVWGSARLL